MPRRRRVELASPPSPPSSKPRIELHVHIEGAVRPAALLDIASRNGIDLALNSPADLERLYEFRDLYEFIEVWNRTSGCLRSPEDYRSALLGYAAEAAWHGAVYLEPIIVFEEKITDWAGTLQACCDAADEALERFGVAVGLTPEVYRGCDVEAAERATETVTGFVGRGVVGFGLSGAEGRYPTAPYARAVATARAAGLGFVPHAGEAAGPESVREVLALGATRLRHGIRAVEDPDLVAELAERGTVLDVTLTSNVRLGVAESIAAHPLPQLVAAGVRCSISTDDPAMFDTDLTAECAAAEGLGVSASAAYAGGLAGALCDEKTRSWLVAIGRDAYGDIC
jgi:aminodeoxyfutalosine deaminase